MITFKELFESELKSLDFKPINRYLLKKPKVVELGNGREYWDIEVDFNYSDEVKKIINQNEKLRKKLNHEDSTLKNKHFYFDL